MSLAPLCCSQGVCGGRGGCRDPGVLQRHAGHPTALQVRETPIRRDPGRAPRDAHVPGLRSAPPAAPFWYGEPTHVHTNTRTPCTTEGVSALY